MNKQQARERAKVFAIQLDTLEHKCEDDPTRKNLERLAKVRADVAEFNEYCDKTWGRESWCQLGG